MKLLNLIAALAFVVSAQGQVTLEKSYKGIGAVSVHNVEGQGYKYSVLDAVYQLVHIYNDDHSLYRTVNTNLPNKHVLTSVNYISSMLFDSDNSIEMLITHYDTIAGASKPKYHTTILKENGTTVTTIDDAYGGYAVKVGSSWKLIAHIITQPTYSDVYSLPGKLLNIKQPDAGDGDVSASFYPNPMQHAATLSYSLPSGTTQGSIRVMNSAGVTVRTMQVTSQFDNVTINRGELVPGVYIYEVSTPSSQPVRSSFVIN